MAHVEIDHNEPLPARNIILVGLMGCGKSTVARELGKMLAYPVLDTDDHIAKLEERTIPEIFKADGEDYFRQCETQLVQSMLDTGIQKHIIATGGGLPTRQESRDLLKKLGYVVWLSADIDTLHERTGRTDHRPLLQTEDPKAVLTQLLDNRSKFYKHCSHLRIKTGDLAINDIACGILDSARYYFSQRLHHIEEQKLQEELPAED